MFYTIANFQAQMNKETTEVYRYPLSFFKICISDDTTDVSHAIFHVKGNLSNTDATYKQHEHLNM